MARPTPTTDPSFTRCFGKFETFLDAIDYAQDAPQGTNFYSARGDLQDAVSYAELVDRARAIARRLMGLGLAPGDRMALIAETGPDFAAFLIGCMSARVLPVPMPVPLAFGGRAHYCEQIRRQVKTCGARAIMASAGLMDYVREAVEGFALDFVGPPEEFEAQAPDRRDLPRARPDDLAYLQYSSGSTRFPLGVAISHHALMTNVREIANFGLEAGEEDRCASWLPFYHDMGLVGFFLVPFACQISADYLAPEDFARRPIQWLSLITKNRATLSYSPSFGYDLARRRANAENLRALDLGSWRAAGIGGDMIRPETIEGFSEVFAPAGFRREAFVPSYGLAENTLAVSFMRLGRGLEADAVDEHRLTGEEIAAPVLNGASPRANGATARQPGPRPVIRRFVNCGRPLPSMTVEIRDRAGRPRGDREVGRVFIRGGALMNGYFGDEDATRAVLSTDGWLDTGDMGYMHDGDIYIVGRLKDMIIANGRNIWPQDIEWAVERLPGVRSGDCAAFSQTMRDGEERAIVLVQCRLSKEDERESFASAVRKTVQRVAGIQAEIVLVPNRSLPRTSSGKLSRSRSKEMYLAGQFSQDSRAPERVLAESSAGAAVD